MTRDVVHNAAAGRCSVGYLDDWFAVGWPLYSIEADADGFVLHRGRSDEPHSWGDVRKLIRCGIGPQWAVRVVFEDGRRWVLWAPRLRRVLDGAPPATWSREDRRLLKLWQQRPDR